VVLVAEGAHDDDALGRLKLRGLCVEGAAGYLPRKPTLCPDCLRTRQIPVVRVSGNVPELLVAALGEGAEIAEIGPDIGPVFAFQAVVRVA
jgi:hypothetical protein